MELLLATAARKRERENRDERQGPTPSYYNSLKRFTKKWYRSCNSLDQVFCISLQREYLLILYVL